MYSMNVRKKSGRNKSEEAVFIDESGQLGVSPDRVYIVAASRVRDEGRFDAITSEYGFRREMKFRKNPKQRMEVLKKINSQSPRIYAVLTPKPFFGYKTELKHEVHRRALEETIKRTISPGDKPVHIVVDENSLVTEDEVRDICRRHVRGRKYSVEVASSKSEYGLQTHDFVVGAIAKKYNKRDPRYADMLGHISVRILKKPNRR